MSDIYRCLHQTQNADNSEAAVAMMEVLREMEGELPEAAELFDTSLRSWEEYIANHCELHAKVGTIVAGGYYSDHYFNCISDASSHMKSGLDQLTEKIRHRAMPIPNSQ